MRRIVVTTPGLSVGKQGAVLTAEQLGMDDDKIDEFIEAGYGTELFGGQDPAPEQTTIDQPADQNQPAGEPNQG